MIRVFFVLLIYPVFVQAQSDSTRLPSFLEFNKEKKYAVILENEGIVRAPKDARTYAITIVVTNIRNMKGVIRFKFYDDATPFPHDKGFLRIVVPKSEVKNGIFKATFYGFTSKYMGVALQDDENSNSVLDFGWLLPKEGHAFSDYYHAAPRRPVFADFRFFLNSDRVVTMKMRYY